MADTDTRIGRSGSTGSDQQHETADTASAATERPTAVLAHGALLTARGAV